MRRARSNARAAGSAAWLRRNHFAWKNVTMDWARNTYGSLQGSMWPAVGGADLASNLHRRMPLWGVCGLPLVGLTLQGHFRLAPNRSLAGTSVRTSESSPNRSVDPLPLFPLDQSAAGVANRTTRTEMVTFAASTAFCTPWAPMRSRIRRSTFRAFSCTSNFRTFYCLCLGTVTSYGSASIASAIAAPGCSKSCKRPLR